ncbi:MAG: SIMPL domain-containing protein [Candidatus Daviesbacteria bacterium]|nr:SIMPL domain-containing protein [Candidatus Daviesbacteria bacterium]
MRSLATFIIPILAFFVILLIYTKAFGPIPFSVNSVNTTKTDTFNVSGEGAAVAKPDMAILVVGIQAEASTVKAAQDQINSIINNVAAAIKKLGVEQKDIQTASYNINPAYDYTGGSQRITGYSASTNLSIKIRSIDLTGQVIDSATGNGANQIGGISFDVDDKSKLEDEARQKAVVAAKKKAESAAKIAGFKLGRIVNYSENFDLNPQPLRMAVGAPAESVNLKTAVEPGSSEIKVIVTLSYEIY